jgi:hypothetical protein
VGARGERLVVGREGGGSRGEAALAVSHSAARVGGSPLPCARQFLWGTFLAVKKLSKRVERYFETGNTRARTWREG